MLTFVWFQKKKSTHKYACNALNITQKTFSIKQKFTVSFRNYLPATAKD